MPGMLKSLTPTTPQAPGMLKNPAPTTTQAQMIGLLNIPPSPPAPSLNAFDAHRRAAMDALVAHEGLLGNRERLIATMGPEGYAKALAAAAEKAEVATAAYRAVWGALSV